jgi:hypothetical protein
MVTAALEMAVWSEHVVGLQEGVSDGRVICAHVDAHSLELLLLLEVVFEDTLGVMAV